jgi:hypothetical protein
LSAGGSDWNFSSFQIRGSTFRYFAIVPNPWQKDSSPPPHAGE